MVDAVVDVDVIASLLLFVEFTEEADDPGSVGDKRGCAVRDSWDPLREICAPRDLVRELGAKRPLSRFAVMLLHERWKTERSICEFLRERNDTENMQART